MLECVFCKIVAGEIPSYKIYEDNDTLAFLDIRPVNNGHVLVIPKKHFQNMEMVDEEILCQVIITVKKVGLAIMSGLGVKGYNINGNNETIAGQIVPHLHFHIIPRSAGDGLKLWPQKKYNEGEAKEVMKKINSAL